jgi:cytochrome c oxidase assembly protein subunit 15
MDLRNGFALWRELGMAHTGDALPFAALTAIHYVHRLSAYVVFIALGWLVWRLWAARDTRPTARWLLALGLWQLLTGVSNVVFDWPLLAAVAHTGGAAALVIVMTGAIFGTRTAYDTVSASKFNISRLT